MTPFVIGVAGGIGSGKTEFARALTSRLGGQFVSFGDFVRAAAAERGLDPSRAVLQDLGARLIAELGWQRFASAVLSPWDRESPLVVDGIRHLEAVAAVRTCVAPFVFRLVFLDADLTLRKARLSGRPSDAENLPTIDAHSTEQAVHSLRSAADLVLNAHDSPDTLADTAKRVFVDAARLPS